MNDDDAQVKPKRPRGRPPGSKTAKVDALSKDEAEAVLVKRSRNLLAVKAYNARKKGLIAKHDTPALSGLPTSAGHSMMGGSSGSGEILSRKRKHDEDDTHAGSSASAAPPFQFYSYVPYRTPQYGATQQPRSAQWQTAGSGPSTIGSPSVAGQYRVSNSRSTSLEGLTAHGNYLSSLPPTPTPDELPILPHAGASAHLDHGPVYIPHRPGGPSYASGSATTQPGGYPQAPFMLPTPSPSIIQPAPSAESLANHVQTPHRDAVNFALQASHGRPDIDNTAYTQAPPPSPTPYSANSSETQRAEEPRPQQQSVTPEPSSSVPTRTEYAHQNCQTDGTSSTVKVHQDSQTDIARHVCTSAQTNHREFKDFGNQAGPSCLQDVLAPDALAPDALAPDALTPDAVTLEPLTPEPPTPEAITPEPPTLGPLTPEPLTPDDSARDVEDASDLESILEQFSEEEATIRWQNGVLTVAPMCRDNDGNNTLQHDLEFVRMLAKYALPAAQCPWITAIEYNADMSDQDLGQRIREALRWGNAVLITGYPRKHRMDRFQMTLAGVCEHFKLKPRATYTTLDAAIRTRIALPSEDEDDDETPPPEDDDAPKPYHVPMTLAEFMEKMNSGRFVRCILDAPSVEDLSVGFISDIDDGITEWYRSRHPNRISQPCDVHESRSWLLFHYGMFHTYPHYDSEGFCTLIRIEKGQKEWVLMRGSGLDKCRTRKQHDKAMRSVGCTDVQFRKDVELYVASVTDGDILIQGPGQSHQVYTPVPTASSGSHFYMIDTMHLTEAVMRYDLSVYHSDTNHGHISAQLTLHLMINAMKDNDRRYYPRKALAALCRMLINPKDYFDQRPEYNRPDTDLAYWRQEYAGKDGVPGMRKRIPKMPDVQQALSNARTLVASLNLDTEMDDTLKNPHETPSFNDYIFRGGFLNPGEDVDIEPVKHLLKSAKMLAPIADDDLAEDVDAYEAGEDDVEDEDYVEPRKKSRKKKATDTKGKGRTRR